jgi:hypothetical protein
MRTVVVVILVAISGCAHPSRAAQNSVAGNVPAEGWWCSASTSGTAGTCYQERSTCDVFRSSMVDHETMTECALQTSADCFDVRKPGEVTPMCTPNRAICQSMRQVLQGDQSSKMQPASDCHTFNSAGERQWWCTTNPAQDGIGACYESRSDCETIRSRVAASGDVNPPCALQASVACLPLRDAERGLIPLCLPTRLTCNMARKFLRGVPPGSDCQMLGVRDKRPWWCTTFQRDKRGYCDRERSVCEAHRAKAAQSDKTISQCAPQRSANCFGSRDMHRVTELCYPSASVCSEQHDHGIDRDSIAGTDCYLAE